MAAASRNDRLGQDHPRTTRSRRLANALKVGVALATTGATVLALHAVINPETSSAAAAGPLINDQFDGYSATSRWTDGQRFGPWRVVFAGYGSVSVPAAKPRMLRLSPSIATQPSETHSALVVSQQSFAKQCIAVRSRLLVRKQTRIGSSPNPWESGWLVWDYLDNDHFSYLAIKTNGWELGKRDPAYPGGQRFLATGGQPVTAVGTSRLASIVRSSPSVGQSTLRAYVDNKLVATFVDSERPYRSGSVGLYVEDAVLNADFVTAAAC